LARRFMRWLQQLEARRFTNMVTNAVSTQRTGSPETASKTLQHGNGTGNANSHSTPNPGHTTKKPLETAEIF
jgi:hypothetical protein